MINLHKPNHQLFASHSHTQSTWPQSKTRQWLRHVWHCSSHKTNSYYISRNTEVIWVTTTAAILHNFIIRTSKLHQLLGLFQEKLKLPTKKHSPNKDTCTGCWHAPRSLYDSKLVLDCALPLLISKSRDHEFSTSLHSSQALSIPFCWHDDLLKAPKDSNCSVSFKHLFD